MIRSTDVRIAIVYKTHDVRGKTTFYYNNFFFFIPCDGRAGYYAVTNNKNDNIYKYICMYII